MLVRWPRRSARRLTRQRMLSIGKLANGQANYYLDLAGERVDRGSRVATGVEDYYVGGAEPPGRWTGGMASEIGLAGEVKAEALKDLLDERAPQDGFDQPPPKKRGPRRARARTAPDPTSNPRRAEAPRRRRAAGLGTSARRRPPPARSTRQTTRTVTRHHGYGRERDCRISTSASRFPGACCAALESRRRPVQTAPVRRYRKRGERREGSPRRAEVALVVSAGRPSPTVHGITGRSDSMSVASWERTDCRAA